MSAYDVRCAKIKLALAYASIKNAMAELALAEEALATLEAEPAEESKEEDRG